MTLAVVALRTEQGFHHHPGQWLPEASIINVDHNRSVPLAVRPMEMLAIALSVRILNPVVTFKRNCLEVWSLKHRVGAVASARVMNPLFPVVMDGVLGLGFSMAFRACIK